MTESRAGPGKVEKKGTVLVRSMDLSTEKLKLQELWEQATVRPWGIK